MTTTTVIPTVAAALKSQIAVGIAALTWETQTPKVFDAFPAGEVQYDYVVIGDILDGRHDYAVMRTGRKPRDEAYLQRIHVVCTRGGPESTQARTDALAMMNVVEDLIANDPAIGTGIPTLRLETREFRLNTLHDTALMGWKVNITLDVLVQARLT